MAELVLKNVHKSFGSLDVIKGVDLSFEHREFIVFVGPSGCGKSTLLRMVAGLESVTSGEIEIADVDMGDLPPSKRGIAMVFQTYALYPHMNVFKNMAYGLKLARAPKAEITEKVNRAAGILQLEDLLDRKPADLSGGQRQRVAIGRAIVRDPKIFLFDEPLSNLDASLRAQMRVEIANLHQRLDATMVYVTHDQVEAMTMADRIVVLNHGVVEQVGKPLELYHNPCNQFVAGFIGSPKMNFFDGKCLAVNPDGATVSVDSFGRIEIPVKTTSGLLGQQVVVGLRPQDCHLGPGDTTFHLKVSIVEPLGDQTVAYGVTEAGNQMTVEVHGAQQVSPRAEQVFHFNLEDCHLFNQNGDACPRLRLPAIVAKEPS